MPTARCPPPPDKGLAAFAGVGPEAAKDFGVARMPQGVEPYDETITSERIMAVGDMYYLWQHEKIGVFRVVQKLQELFRAGTVRLSAGPGAFALYQFDRREVLRYTKSDRLSAYKRIFGYGGAPVPTGSRANTDFHKLFSHFVHQVTLFWRDKRISDVIRERAYDPSFGSIAIVRRAGLDLRNNLKWLSFGHLNVLRVEVMQLLEEAFKILDSDDVKRLFGADNAWDVVEEVLIRYFNERLVTSPRQRMGVTGREVLRWLAQPHILQTTRSQFETLAARDRGAIGRVAHQRAGDGSGQAHRLAPRAAVGSDATDAHQGKRPARKREFLRSERRPVSSNWNTKSDRDVTPRHELTFKLVPGGKPGGLARRPHIRDRNNSGDHALNAGV